MKLAKVINPSPLLTMMNLTKAHKEELKEHFGATAGISDKTALGIGIGVVVFIFLLVILYIVLSIVAINKVFSKGTEESNKYKVIAYIAWLLTGGSIGWVFILLWMFKIKM